MKKNKEGKFVPRFKIAFSKPSKRFVAKKVKKAKNYNFLNVIKRDIYYRSFDRRKEEKEVRLARKRSLFVAPRERPDREVVIEICEKYSRM